MSLPPPPTPSVAMRRNPHRYTLQPSLIQDTLLASVAAVLHIPRHDISLADSFQELGGTHESADLLKRSCLAAGLKLRDGDAIRCRTLAELQTCIAPLSATPITPPPPPSHSHNQNSSLDSTSSADNIFTPSSVTTRYTTTAATPPPPVLRRPRSYSRPLVPSPSKQHHHQPLPPIATTTTTTRETTEALIQSDPAVSRAALVVPKAGFLEDKLVAFICLNTTTTTTTTTTTSDVITMVSHANFQIAKTHVALLSCLLETSPANTSSPPHAWVVLESMPLDPNTHLPERRKLQTWAQNINRETYQRILSLDSSPPLPEGPPAPPPKKVDEPVTDVERTIRTIVSRVLRVPRDQVGMSSSFRQLGGDDISALQIISACRAQSLLIKPGDILSEDYSLSQLAFHVSTSTGALGKRWQRQDPPSSSLSQSCFSLSPMQRLYFHTGVGGDAEKRRRPDAGIKYRFNTSLLLRIKNPWTPLEDVRAALETVVGHHPMLRARFRNTTSPQSWKQTILPRAQGAFNWSSQSIATNDDMVAAIAAAQTSIDIVHGPVFAAKHFVTRDDNNNNNNNEETNSPHHQQLLFLVAHHLVIDLVSWRIIIHDLDDLLTKGTLVSETAMPFEHWNNMQQRQIQRIADVNHPDLVLPFKVAPGDFSYWGIDMTTTTHPQQDSGGGGSNTYGDAVEVGFSLTPELTAILQTACNDVFRTDSADIYLAALLLSFAQTFRDRPAPVMWNQEHGRRETFGQQQQQQQQQEATTAAAAAAADIAETVGWFTSLCPIFVDVDMTLDFLHVLRCVKDVRRSVPRRGWSYFASQVMGGGSHASQLKPPDWPFEIMFTYAGSLQQLEKDGGVLEQIGIPGRTFDSLTSDIGADVGRIALFEVTAMIDAGSAKIKFVYNRNARHQDRIAQWVSAYEHLLLEAVGRLRYRQQELTLADVPHLNTDYQGLATFNTDRLAALGLASAKEVDSVYPATAVQQDILVSQSRDPQACHSHFIYDLSLEPSLSPSPATATSNPVMVVDQARLCEAWEHIVAAYPALRTVFVDSVTPDGLFDQVVLRRCSPRMLFLEVSVTEDPVATLSSLPPLQCASGFEPRHRLTVCKSFESTFIKIEISQALCDAMSVGKIVHDLRRVYAMGRSALRPPRLSYPGALVDVLLEPQRRQQGRDFWKAHLANVKPCMFPEMTPPQPDTEPDAGGRSYDLDITLAAVEAFCHANSIDKAAVLRVAWGLVLRVYTDSTNVCFGYRVSGRDVPGVLPDGMQAVVGGFENVIPCPIQLPADASIDNVLREQEEQLLASLPHYSTSNSEIRHALGVRSAALFNTCLIFRDGRDDPPPPPTTTTKWRATTATANAKLVATCSLAYNSLDFDVLLTVMFRNGRLIVHISHRVLSDMQVKRLMAALSCAISSVLASQPAASAAAPTTASRVGDIDLFTEDDRAQLKAWELSIPTTGRAVDMCVHQLVLRTVKERPEGPAVCAWDGDFTYRQVGKLSSKLAHHLMDRGIGPGVNVPVVLDKSRWAVVTMLAVLRTGARYVPIDFEDMQFVKASILQLGAKHVLATEKCYRTLEPLLSGESLMLISDALLTAPTPTPAAASAPPRVTPEDAACIILSLTAPRYKEARGIYFTHLALSSAFVAQGEALSIDAQARVMQLSSFGVHTSLVEVFATLIHGGCVCLPSPQERIDDFAGAVNRMRVNWSYMTPMLARRVKPNQVEPLTVVLFRTRLLDEDTWAPWAVNKRVLLAYGAPDVCPLATSVLEVKTADDLKQIARPFLGSFWIVNPENNRQLTPIGAVGELVVQTPTLSHRFYPARPPTPVFAGGGAEQSTSATAGKLRYFKTGHHVRYSDTGRIHFLSNVHDEIIIDGQPIQSAALEQRMRRCLQIEGDLALSLVTAIDDHTPILALFFELGDSGINVDNDDDDDNDNNDGADGETKSGGGGGGGESPFGLSDRARELVFASKQRILAALEGGGSDGSVHAYMIPQVFIPVRRLPMTPSLKINRKRLQKMVSWMTRPQLDGFAQPPTVHSGSDDSSSNAAAQHQQLLVGLKPLPLTHVEEHMRDIWADILGLDKTRIRGTDVFMKLGAADDYLATRLVITCREAKMAISINDVLRNASLTELCQSVTAIEDIFCPPLPPSSPSKLPLSLLPSEQYQQQQQQPPSSAGGSSYEQGGGIGSTIRQMAVQLDEKLVEDVAMAQLGVERFVIKDFAEASYAQMEAMQTAMRSPRSGVGCVVLNINGAVQHKRLRAACEILSKVHTNLRTVFVTQSRTMYQVVLRTVTPEFERYPCPAWRVSSLADKLVKKELHNNTVPLSRPFAKFLFVDSSKQSTLIIRLSRAQYDEASMPVLVQDLRRIYGNTEPVPRRPSHCEFARSAMAAIAKGAVPYWKALLDGAKMTEVVKHNQPRPLSDTLKTLRRTVAVVPLTDVGIAFDTVLKTAWAMVLATLSGYGDVVFGEYVAGRHISLANGQGFAGLYGPTHNAIPVRVTFADEPTTPLELLGAVHSQRVAGLPFENMGMLEIVKKCTSWAYWTRFSTVVHHKYCGEESSSGSGDSSSSSSSSSATLNLGSAICTYSTVGAPLEDVPDLFVSSMQTRPDRAEVAIRFCEQRVPEDFAADALRMLCSTIERLTAGPMSQPVVPSAVDYGWQQKHIPLKVRPDSGANGAGGAGASAAVAAAAAAATASFAQASQISKEQQAVIREVIAKAWRKYLEPVQFNVPDKYLHGARLFDVWGSLIPAAQMAEYIVGELPKHGVAGLDGIQLTMEEMLEHATMEKQAILVASKVHSSGSGGGSGGILKPTAVFSPKSPVAWGRTIRRRLTNDRTTAGMMTVGALAGSVFGASSSSPDKYGSSAISDDDAPPAVPMLPPSHSASSSMSGAKGPAPRTIDGAVVAKLHAATDMAGSGGRQEIAELPAPQLLLPPPPLLQLPPPLPTQQQQLLQQGSLQSSWSDDEDDEPEDDGGKLRKSNKAAAKQLKLKAAAAAAAASSSSSSPRPIRGRSPSATVLTKPEPGSYKSSGKSSRPGTAEAATLNKKTSGMFAKMGFSASVGVGI